MYGINQIEIFFVMSIYQENRWFNSVNITLITSSLFSIFLYLNAPVNRVFTNKFKFSTKRFFGQSSWKRKIVKVIQWWASIFCSRIDIDNSIFRKPWFDIDKSIFCYAFPTSISISISILFGGEEREEWERYQRGDSNRPTIQLYFFTVYTVPYSVQCCIITV